jgi:acetyltransferase (GNAT) family protein
MNIKAKAGDELRVRLRVACGSRSATHCIDVARDDSIRLRRATIADAEPLARGVIEGVGDYPSFAPPGWTAPSFEAELRHPREVLPDPDVCCLVAESEGALVGQITRLPAARAPLPVEDPSRAHISNLLVRRDHWGVGLAAPSLSTSGETLTIEELLTLRARTENAGDVGVEHEWSRERG